MTALSTENITLDHLAGTYECPISEAQLDAIVKHFGLYGISKDERLMQYHAQKRLSSGQWITFNLVVNQFNHFARMRFFNENGNPMDVGCTFRFDSPEEMRAEMGKVIAKYAHHVPLYHLPIVA